MTRRKKIFLWVLGGGFGLLAITALAGAGVFLYALHHYGKDLPDYRQLADYEPSVMTRIHAGDGSLLTEYAREKRLFVPINVMPERVIEAFLSAEDKNFYTHSGFDYFGIARAMLTNVKNVATNKRLVGASTITQQVSRYFLLTADQTSERKIKEAIIAARIEKAFTKDQILELYLNEIYLGSGSHGVAAAALNYFDKPLDELTIEEAAYLAALPKGPANYHPVRNYERAVARRNWVMAQMAENGFITREEKEEAQARPLVTRQGRQDSIFRADYFEEEIRRELYKIYGDKNLYEGGLSVRTTLEPSLQAIAEQTLREGLVAYDRRHGWRGALGKITVSDGWPAQLEEIDQPLGIDDWHHAVVLELRAEGAIVGLKGESYGFVPFEQVKWARAWRPQERLGPGIEDIADVLNVGDVIAVKSIINAGKMEIAGFVDNEGAPLGSVATYSLQQIPAIEGGLVALDPHTGRVLAMVGGYDYKTSEYNRATQAERQPGSAFKPFVYAAALDEGFTPSSLVLDAPFVIDQGEGQGKWKPKNSSDKFYGPSTLRLGLEKSRNLMTVRLAQYIGMDKVINYANRFDIGKNVQPNLATALGAGEVSLLKLTTAYAMLVNGGKQVKPTLIDRIQDRRGKTIFKHDQRICETCNAEEWRGQDEPAIPDERKQVVDPRIAYQTVSMLEGVVRSGTGRSIRSLGIPLAGKTGTTDDSFDAWFVGFSPDLVVGVFAGFDRPRSLGNGEEGSSIAAPVFRAFMAEALKGKAPIPFRIPPGIRLVRVNAETGQPALPGDKNIIFEAFIPGTEPTGELAVLDDPTRMLQINARSRRGAEGIY